jgi:hypothetical protein
MCQAFTCSGRFVLTTGAVQQPAAGTQQTVAVAAVMFALFALQTDQIRDVTFPHYHFSVFFS